ncbi:hypothetical protein KR054_006981, partial [Drosophila jambulina]
ENREISKAQADYLNKFMKPKNLQYLPVEKLRHSLIPQRSSCNEVKLPPSKVLLTENIRLIDHISNDPLSRALAERRNSNDTKTISTIIFISTRNLKGFVVSGFIDFGQSIHRFKNGDTRTHPWSDILAGKRRLQPSRQDLSFMSWKSGRVFYNESDNYKVIPDPVKGLCFKYKGDGTLIYIEKKIADEHPACSYIESPKHGSAVIYDHRIRRKL